MRFAFTNGNDPARRAVHNVSTLPIQNDKQEPNNTCDSESKNSRHGLFCPHISKTECWNWTAHIHSHPIPMIFCSHLALPQGFDFFLLLDTQGGGSYGQGTAFSGFLLELQGKASLAHLLGSKTWQKYVKMTRPWQKWFGKSKLRPKNWHCCISHYCIELSFDCESPTSTTKSGSHPSDAVRLHLSWEMFSTQLTQNDAVAIKDADIATIAVNDLSPKISQKCSESLDVIGMTSPAMLRAHSICSLFAYCHLVSIKALSLSAIFSTESQGSEMAWTSFTFSFSIFWNTTSLKLAPVGHTIWRPGRTNQWQKSGWIIPSGR